MSNPIFNKGDQVVCIDDGGYEDITVGKVYVVATSSYQSIVGIFNNNGHTTGYYHSRFIHAEKYLHDKAFDTKLEEWIE